MPRGKALLRAYFTFSSLDLMHQTPENSYGSQHGWLESAFEMAFPGAAQSVGGICFSRVYPLSLCLISTVDQSTNCYRTLLTSYIRTFSEKCSCNVKLGVKAEQWKVQFYTLEAIVKILLA